MGWGVGVTPRPLFTPWKYPVPIVQEVWWAPDLVWTGVENLAPTGMRSPDRPARSQSLYRLSYPAHRQDYWVIFKFLTTNPEIVAACLKIIHWRGNCLGHFLAPSLNGRLIFAAGKIWLADIPKLFGWVGKKFIYHFQVFSQYWEKQLSASLLSGLSVCLSVRPSVCLSARLSFCIEHFGTYCKDFHTIWYLIIFRSRVEKTQDSLTCYKNNA